MEKKYITPSVKVREITEDEAMMTTSVNVDDSGETVTPGEGGYEEGAKGNAWSTPSSVWDEDEEE